MLNPDLQWQGFVPNATTPSTVKITDLYDCDGSKGINAIVIDSAGQWCVACQAIVQEVPIWLSPSGDNWTKLGVQILNLVIQNNDYEPATITTAQQWRDQYNLTSIYVVADPNDTFPTNELPYELLVDPRTMKVVHNLSDRHEPGGGRLGSERDPAREEERGGPRGRRLELGGSAGRRTGDRNSCRNRVPGRPDGRSPRGSSIRPSFPGAAVRGLGSGRGTLVAEGRAHPRKAKGDP